MRIGWYKADPLLDHFDGMQSIESVDKAVTCHPSPSLSTFRSSEVRHLLLDLDSYFLNDSLGMFTLFRKRNADVMAPRLSAWFGDLFV